MVFDFMLRLVWGLFFWKHRKILTKKLSLNDLWLVEYLICGLLFAICLKSIVLHKCDAIYNLSYLLVLSKSASVSWPKFDRLTSCSTIDNVRFQVEAFHWLSIGRLVCRSSFGGCNSALNDNVGIYFPNNKFSFDRLPHRI